MGDYGYWKVIVQFGIIAAAIIFSNCLRRRVRFFRNSLMPTAALAGFIVLLLKFIPQFRDLLSIDVMDKITYHGIAIGFIAMSLCSAKKDENENAGLVGAKSGALIVSTYLVQALVGIGITILLGFIFFGDLGDIFKASGILLPMGYGQGPGQANNVGLQFQENGLPGGQAFGASIAAAGFLCACIVGVIYINVVMRRKNMKIDKLSEKSENFSNDVFCEQGEIPVSEAVDKFTIQAALVLVVYLLTYLFLFGITELLKVAGLEKALGSIFWGFNFIFASMIATITKVFLKKCRQKKIIRQQYHNNYLLSRISGLAFDFMIVAGIASINIENLKGLWVPFIIVAVAGGVATLLYLKWMCKKLYPNYYYEGFVSMFGMLTGTISSGVLLLREIDPNLKTPAANNMILGSSFGIIFGAPMLVIIALVQQSFTMTLISLALIAFFLVCLLIFMLKAKPKKKK